MAPSKAGIKIPEGLRVKSPKFCGCLKKKKATELWKQAVELYCCWINVQSFSSKLLENHQQNCVGLHHNLLRLYHFHVSTCKYLLMINNWRQQKRGLVGPGWGSESLWPKFWFCKLFLFKHGDYSGFPWNCSPDTSSYQYIKIDINCVKAQYLDRAEKHLHISWNFAGSCLKPWQQ